MVFKAKMAVESNPSLWTVAELSHFYTTNRSELLAHANRILKDKAKAEEILQESLLKFILAAPELSSDSHALAYLHRTIENLCIDLLRVEKRRPNLVALDSVTSEVELTWQDSGDFSTEISAAEDAAIIRQALSLLSPAERAALIMWEIEGRSTSEIAEALNIKDSAVRHTVSRARASLRKILSELIIDEARGLTALELLSTTYRKSVDIVGKSSKIALTFILVLTAFLGLNSLTGNELSTSTKNYSSEFLIKQDLPMVAAPASPSETSVSKKILISDRDSTSLVDYANHMELSLAQLETTTLMLSVLEQINGEELTE
jgi:RNA polymerase sigma factor (sigma-70 family)